jgi:hypothetical protein
LECLGANLFYEKWNDKPKANDEDEPVGPLRISTPTPPQRVSDLLAITGLLHNRYRMVAGTLSAPLS